MLYEADVASDLSVFHRVDDVAQLTAPRYFALVYRLAAYGGAVAARLRMAHAGAPATAPAPVGPASGRPRLIDPSEAEIEAMFNAARIQAHGKKAAAGGINYVDLATITTMSGPN